jgi:rhodanese-related sulfurtransferase
LVQAASGRIPGARAVDVERIQEGIDGVPRDGEVIVYCACPNEATAVKVAQALIQQGFRRVRPLLGGIDAWIAAGHDVEPVARDARTDVLNS